MNGIYDKKTKISNEHIIVQTDVESKDGQEKCPKCGATDISTNVNNGKLRCNFCRYEFEPIKITGMVEDVSKLQGEIIGSGAQNIIEDTNDVLTFKCSSCGAEVVIDTAFSTQARCHWCRNTLSVNQQIPNGAIPDVVLPFNVSKEIAKGKIESFVAKRKFFAHPNFKKEFNINNIMGVYFPYMLVDINAHVKLVGEGEHQTRRYYKGSGDNKRTYYDADLYHVERDFDLAINGLSIESSSDKLNNSVLSDKTNNIINSIMPFDVENCAKYNSNYIKGYTSERRDVNIEQLKDIVEVQSKDIARYSANDSLGNYDRGVAWSQEKIDINGQQWKAAYLPVWLYSYQEQKGSKNKLHYVAVNGRTKETMGSVPIHMPKLLGVSTLVELLGIMLFMFVDWDYSILFLLSGFIFYIMMFIKYRNSNARHTYETDTKRQITNLKKIDNFIKSKKGLSNSKMVGANNKEINGQSIGESLINNIVDSIGID